jgi:hypothetical protein
MINSALGSRRLVGATSTNGSLASLATIVIPIVDISSQLSSLNSITSPEHSETVGAVTAANVNELSASAPAAADLAA